MLKPRENGWKRCSDPPTIRNWSRTSKVDHGFFVQRIAIPKAWLLLYEKYFIHGVRFILPVKTGNYYHQDLSHVTARR